MDSFDIGIFEINPVQEKDAWRICDFTTVNATRLKRYFPKTLEATLTPELSAIFVAQKVKEFQDKTEFLFVVKNKIERTVAGLVYVKSLDYQKLEAELAYCIGYQYEGLGITTKIVQHLTNWSFDKLKLNQLRIIVHKTNIGSVRIAEKCGYIWKETLPNEHQPPEEALLDMELYIKTNER
ncbi:GNAT family N-acetyltransferase [Maribacter sp. MMG018]|uniref:GNAT family N-acetyltransferase n=1 Tax=Maribacter sp. MMG018 TaxID=2822688 RepID=UPI001B367731|nr:GNAT family N-acetyltransferase [Maribacter sp. MMG018]MBQ4913533.1 GNAT family N-acetyltransferase [Maribacter sp. MMG018]